MGIFSPKAEPAPPSAPRAFCVNPETQPKRTYGLLTCGRCARPAFSEGEWGSKEGPPGLGGNFGQA